MIFFCIKRKYFIKYSIFDNFSKRKYNIIIISKTIFLKILKNFNFLQNFWNFNQHCVLSWDRWTVNESVITRHIDCKWNSRILTFGNGRHLLNTYIYDSIILFQWLHLNTTCLNKIIFIIIIIIKYDKMNKNIYKIS